MLFLIESILLRYRHSCWRHCSFLLGKWIWDGIPARGVVSSPSCRHSGHKALTESRCGSLCNHLYARTSGFCLLERAMILWGIQFLAGNLADFLCNGGQTCLFDHRVGDETVLLTNSSPIDWSSGFSRKTSKGAAKKSFRCCRLITFEIAAALSAKSSQEEMSLISHRY